MSFTGLVIVCAVAFAAPLLLGMMPRVRMPAIVLEILAGIAIGPAGLGWVTIDEPIRVLSVLGLAFLLFLAGLELDLSQLVGIRLRLAAIGAAISVVIAYAIAFPLHVAGMVESPLLVAIALSATAIGIVLPVLKDADLTSTSFGQLIMAAASIADFGTVLLLSLLFSREATDLTAKLVLIGGFAVLIVVIAIALSAAGRWNALDRTLLRLQDSTSQIRIRGAFLMMVGLAAIAVRQGLEVILGTFVAGALVAILDHNYRVTHPKFHEKLEVIGFGVFIPVFFVSSGIRFDAGALFSSVGTLMRVPMFLAALLVVRGIPALLYLRLIGRPRVLVAGLLQATSLPFIVVTTTIGIELKEMTPSNASALVAAGLLSVVIFPAAALSILRKVPAEEPQPAA